MATWGPIQLRLKGSRQVEFEGEASPAPGGGSMPFKVEAVAKVYADFTETAPASGYATASLYDLEPGEQLLCVLGRVTEAFNDSSMSGPAVQAIASASFPATETLLLQIESGGSLPSPVDGLIGLVSGGNSGSITQWTPTEPVTPDSVAVPILGLLNGYAGDGTTGAVTYWLYIVTP